MSDSKQNGPDDRPKAGTQASPARPPDEVSSSAVDSAPPEVEIPADAKRPPDTEAATKPEYPAHEEAAAEATANAEAAAEVPPATDPRREAEPPAAPPPSPPPKSSGGSHGKRVGTGLLWLLVVLLILAVAYLGWQHWEQLQRPPGVDEDAFARLEQRVVDLDGEMETARRAMASRLDEVEDDLGATRRELEARLSDFEGEMASGQRALAARLSAAEERRETGEQELRQRLRRQEGRINEIAQLDRDGWLLAEADYLLRMASQRLRLERDTQVAIGLLESADRLLRDLDDSELYHVSRALASDLQALRRVERVDRAGLYIRLDAAQEAVAAVPVERHEHRLGERLNVEQEPRSDADAPAEWWQRSLQALRRAWSHLDDYIRIYRRDAPLEPLLSPDDERHLRLNLHLMLQQAQVALLQEEPAAYTVSLTKATQWLEDYFPDSEQTRALRAEFEELREVEVVQEVPELGASLEAMREVTRARPVPQADGDREPES